MKSEIHQLLYYALIVEPRRIRSQLCVVGAVVLEVFVGTELPTSPRLIHFEFVPDSVTPVNCLRLSDVLRPSVN